MAAFVISAVASATVGVMGSSQDEHDALAAPLGRLLARLEVNLLTGGGRGVMTSVCRAYLDARRGRGISIGVIPCAGPDERHKAREGSPNPYIELPILTHLPLSGTDGTDELSRNHINILTSTVVVALPGSSGTASELELALRYGRPAVVFAESAAQVQHFNPAIERLFDLDAVERFVLAHLEQSSSEVERT